MTNDLNTLSNLYEAVISNENRFQGIKPELIPIIKKAEEKMSWAIKNVQLNDVFFSGILDRMIPNQSIQMINFNEPTMYTDGKGLFYNPEFVNKLPLDAVETVIVHEILHVAFGHHLAFADIAKNHQNLWKLVNIACDLAINHLLKDRSGFYKRMLLAGKGEFKDFPQGLDAREYYNLLLKKYQKQPPPPEQPEEQGGEQGEGQGEEGEGEGSGQGEDDKGETGEGGGSEQGEEGQEGEGEGSGGEGEGEEGEGEGSGSGEGEGEGEGTGTGTGKGGKPSKGKGTGQGGAGAGQSQAEQDQNVEIPSDVVQSSQELGRISTPEGVTPQNQTQEQTKHDHEVEKEAAQADSIEQKRNEAGIQSSGYGKGSSAFVNQNYRDLFKQKSNLPWNTILAEFLSSMERTDRSYSVMNKRFSEFTRKTGMLMPGYKEDKLKDLVFLVDISGSMPRTACEKVFGEIAAVTKLKVFGSNSSIRLITFDDGPLSEDIFTADPNIKYRSVVNPDQFVDRSRVYRLPLSETVFSTFKWTSGGGGTRIKPALQNIERYLKPLPALVIILTDGYFNMDDNDYINSVKLPYKTVWLMTTDITFSQGKTFHLSEYNYDLTRR